MTRSAEVLEIHLEELGQHSMVKSFLNVLGGSYGSAQFRFVARPAGPDRSSAEHVLGATFPVLRFQDLDNRTKPNAWVDTAEERLDELGVQLEAEGWVRQPGLGGHWWSRTYAREPRSSQGPRGRPPGA
jgi:hypothetical protein